MAVDFGEDLTVTGRDAKGRLVRVTNHLRTEAEALQEAREFKAAYAVGTVYVEGKAVEV